LNIEAQITDLGGDRVVRNSLSGDRNDAEKLGVELAERLLLNGGSEILSEFKELDNSAITPELS